MKHAICLGLSMGIVAALAAFAPSAVRAAEKEKGRIFELRVYYCNPGKLDDLNKRFRDHTCKLFEKHGIQCVGFWTLAADETPKNPLISVDQAKDVLFYIVAFPSAEAQKKSWTAFQNDPAWKKAKAESEKEGVLVKEVKSQNLLPVDYSPIK